MRERDPREEAVANRLLLELLEDRARGRESSLAAYQSRYPGFEDLVARELERVRLGPDAAPAPEAQGAPGAPATNDASGAGWQADGHAGGPLAAGARIGRYRLVEELGRGGQGSVWRAEDTRLARTVALKVLPAASLWTPEALARFRREAAIAAKLAHPGICAVFDAGTAGGVAYVAMRLVEGETLAHRLARARAGEAPLEREEAVRVVEQAALALAAAHASGVVHRDVKPGNLMLERDGRVVVLDFGLARELEEEDRSALTRSGDRFGTPAYMAPEQIEGRPCDARADVWALGVTLHEALTLRQPFRAPTREALYRAILAEEPPDPRASDRRFPRDLAVILATALAKDPARRYASARDLAEDLRAFLERRPISARPAGPLERALRWARREPGRAALAAGAALAALAAAVSAGYLVASRGEIEAGTEALARRAREDLVRDVMSGVVRDASVGERLRTTLAQDPRLDAQRGVLALELSRLARFDEALAVLDAAPPDSEDPRALARVRAMVLRRAHRPEEADAVRAELGEPRTALECYFASLDVEESRGPDSATRAFELARRAVFLAPAPGETMLARLLLTAHSLGRADEARLAADALEARFPDSALAWFWIGLVWYDDDPPRARRAVERALALDPLFAQPYVSMHLFLAQDGDHAAAREVFERGLALTPEGSDERKQLLAVRLKVCRATGQMDEALATSERIVAMDPTSVPDLLVQAELLQALERTDDADELLGRVLELDPENPTAHRLLGF